MPENEPKTIIAVEIGSSKIRGAIGTLGSDNTLTIQAVEEEPMTDWVRYGAVSNVEEVAGLTNRIIRKIENRIAPRKVKSVYLNIGGRSLCTMPREVEQSFAEDTEITAAIINELITDARDGSPYADRDTLVVVPRHYYIDKREVSVAKGTVGHNIRMAANLVTCRPQTRRNLERLFNDKLKLSIAGIKVRPLALADAVLTKEEKRLGCMFVDFGAETTTVAIFKGGALQFLSTLPMGSRLITRDIQALKYTEERAEELKIKVGSASSPLATGGRQAAIPPEHTAINNYVLHRAAEIIANIKNQLKQSGYTAADLPEGIIIVGGGARLNGFTSRLSTALTMNIRLGSVDTSRMRIADGHISPTDSADILALLLAATETEAEECTQRPAPQPAPQPVQQHVQEQPIYQQPAYQQPTYQQPVYQQPAQQQPVYQQPAQQQPVYQQPTQQPVYQQPVQPEPALPTQPTQPTPTTTSTKKKWMERVKNWTERLMTEEPEDNDYRDD
ncbi:MAG: rod shape-determining protein [Paramuribaculum sp.]|nr:rod shape-determining protein [Paramuribaculum sp.]